MQLVNCTKNTIIAQQVNLADTFWLRLKGLLGRKHLPAGQALVLYPCSAVHTFFMQFAIDLVFLDKQGTVVRLQENMVPWRLSPYVPRAVVAVELPLGSIKAGCIEHGDTLAIVGGVKID
ncbi:DUF192 domain-containing protein [Desulforamulus hydrothermalis]|uniref:DUF192 domain-containing protein n=1 Tax=Desulforamulus hydrothermalis Lam5 = DSM 18033 TaxID=1121428 RepID=K8EDZ2_9FIRM|nr:DUF192 domain-containing protein [Desulforamulus hydrothermalis]CCO07021.1 conserved hypothetical protein [Desulforamulus hydrothermalis Lam5 = DSM 18033]SHG97412.1 hypothetical protein SAMN02745177_00956 [Desulforamulus hydrothermalis Lam5 = DSM 18033]